MDEAAAIVWILIACLMIAGSLILLGLTLSVHDADSITFNINRCTLMNSTNLTSHGFPTGDVYEEWNCTGIRTSSAEAGRRL